MTDDPYRDPSLPVERRVDDLLGRMTLAEKAAQLTSVYSDALVTDGELDESAAADLLADGVGQITRIAGGAGLEPADAAAVANDVQAFLREETRLGIPAILHEECLSGYMGPGGTVYPQAIGLASTWDPGLVETVTAAIRDQLEAVGAVQALSPVFDLGRDPRWGRIEETFGEDPTLVAAMATAYVEGLQGEHPGDGVAATPKHFVGHGATAGGKNRASADIPPRRLREEHAFPFEVAIRTADAESVMNAYHDIDGRPCASNDDLLTGLLRGEWGFDGIVVSDYYSVEFLAEEHRVAESDREAAIEALEAGIDVELPRRRCYGDPLVDAVEDGDLAESTLDRSVRRVLRTKVRKGLFEDPTVDAGAAPDAFETDDQRALSRRAARDSIVLLQNEGDLLPLDPDAGSVAVVGPQATATRGILGDYAYPAHVPDDDVRVDIVSPLDGVRNATPAGTDVLYARGCTATGPSTEGFDEAVETAAGADVAVAFVGARSAIGVGEDADAAKRDRPQVPTSGEGNDVTDLGLPGVQEELVGAVAETDTPLVVVVVSGKPHAVPEIADSVPALAHAWLPGEEGGNAIADVLFGRHPAGGRLPVSIPEDVGQLPIHYRRKPNTRSKDHVYVDADPLFPFGYGLTYTEFAYRDVEVSPGTIRPSGTVSVAATVENVGERAGAEVVQCYVRDEVASRARPVQELEGFARVDLDPGESARVTFEVAASGLAFHDADMNLVVEPGTFEARVGRSADDIELTAGFEVEGERKRVPSPRRYLTDVAVE